MTRLKHIAAAALAAHLALTPAMAEDGSSEDFRDGAKALGEAMEHFFEGLTKEMEPVAEAWRQMLDDLQDLPQYEAPEELPNGDIIIRRKQPEGTTEL